MTRVLLLVGVVMTAWAVVPHDAVAGAPVMAEIGDDGNDRTPGGIELPPSLPAPPPVLISGPGHAVLVEPTASPEASPDTASPLVVAPKTSPPARS